MVGYLDGVQERIIYPNRLATQLRNSHEYQKHSTQEKTKLISLRNQWMDTDKQLNYENAYDKVVDVFSNLKSKGLTHEVMESRQSHLNSIVKKGLQSVSLVIYNSTW